jgi:hypothetical protein
MRLDWLTTRQGLPGTAGGFQKEFFLPLNPCRLSIVRDGVFVWLSIDVRKIYAQNHVFLKQEFPID